MKRNIFIASSIILALLFAYAGYSWTVENTRQLANNSTPKNKYMQNNVTLKTTEGDIVLELSSDKPKTVENFKKLVVSGYYDGIKFHRVISGFMIQAGDPTSKDDTKKDMWGTGGPGYDFEDELTGGEKYPKGTLAMANRGPNTNGSQFFIVTADNAPLPPAYTVFGKVVSGLEVAMKIESAPTDGADRPITDIVINKATLN